MEECPPGTKVPGYHKPEEKKEVWSVIWSEDNPDMCALMEKNRMFVMRNYKQEEPVLSSGYLCHFSDLEVKAAMLDDILKSPEDIKNISEFIESYECRSLRDTRDHLTTISLKDAVEFVDENPHPRLWKLIAEAALDKLDFQIAEKAFVKIEDYHGIKFLKRLKNIDDKHKQKAEISAYFNKFDEAEQIYREIDRKDLAMELRMRLGDWSKVVTLIEQGVGDDDILKEAYNKMGEFCIDKQRWNKAAFYFQQANNFEALIDVYYRLEQFDNMDRLIEDIPPTSPALPKLAEKMQSIGLCESAVKAYIKSGDVKKAVDCCVLLNQWNQAVELAEQHNFLAIEQLLARYATHLIQKDKKMEAVELYRKANKNTESARLLADIASKLQAQRAPPLMIKKIYVLAAFEVDSYKQRVFDASMTQITGGGNTADATAKTLNSLITTDINTSADKALSNPWKGAEAIHFYLLCQRQLYQKEFQKAMKTSIRLMEYEKELDTKEVYSLIALSSYYNKCYKEASKAFVKLERLSNISKQERDKYESIALSMFSRHAPNDAPCVKFPCPKKG
jgi:WD repeat-containing protein 35